MGKTANEQQLKKLWSAINLARFTMASRFLCTATGMIEFSFKKYFDELDFERAFGISRFRATFVWIFFFESWDCNRLSK
jgi:hypothetical protein